MGSIKYWNRYMGCLETEAVYGDKELRWLYSTRSGRLCLELIVKRIVFSRLYGWRMDRAASRLKIRPFIDKYGIDEDGMVKSVNEFTSFIISERNLRKQRDLFLDEISKCE